MHVHAQVLVLNQNYEPLGLCSLRRAVVLLVCGKAEALVQAEHGVRTVDREIEAPSVIRLHVLIRRPRPQVKLTRRDIFLRDSYTCQYCGIRARDLTLDHVVPRSKNGPHRWENLVSACRACNHRKGGKSLQEARMRLLREPFRPRAGAYYLVQRNLRQPVHPSWEPFVPGISTAAAMGTV